MATVKLILFCLLFAFVAAKKTVEQSTQTETEKKLFDFKALNPRELLQWGAMVLLTIVVGLSDKKGEIRRWQTLEAFGFSLEGLLLYFCPEAMHGVAVTGKADKFHIFLIQCCGALEVGLGFTTYNLIKNASSDSLVKSSWLISRVLLYIPMLVIQIHTQMSCYEGPQHYSNLGFGMGVSITGLFLIFALFHLMCLSGGTRKRTGRLTFSLQTCILLLAISLFNVALSQLIFPEYMLTQSSLLSSADPIHLGYQRFLGCFSLAFVCQLIASLKFDEDEDRLAFFKGLLVTHLMLLPMTLLYQWKEPIYTQYGAISTTVFSIFMFMLSLCAMNKHIKCPFPIKSKTN